MAGGPYVILVTSDTHCGSTVGLCTPDPIPLDDGGAYMPSDAQKWLWDAWERTIREAEKARTEFGGEFIWISNGDAIEGDHHNTPQLPTRLTLTHGAIFRECIQPILDLRPDHIVGVRGTEAHVGPSASGEEGIYRGLRAEGHNVVTEPVNGTATWWHWRAELAGLLLDATHHGRMGQRAHTRDGYLRHYAHDIWVEHLMDGHRPPDLAIRSHFHQWGDSGIPNRRGTRVVATPCYQLKTGYVHKRHPETLADVGGVLIIIEEGEPVTVRPIVQRPARGPVWRPSHD